MYITISEVIFSKKKIPIYVNSSTFPLDLMASQKPPGSLLVYLPGTSPLDLAGALALALKLCLEQTSEVHTQATLRVAG